MRSASSLLVSAASNLIFSSSRICPGFNSLTLLPAPTISAENSILILSNSPSRIATGANESSLLRSPFGLPRWAIITIEQFAANSFLIVLSEAIILPSSVICPSLIGTFKSQRKTTCVFWGFNSASVLMPINIKVSYQYIELDQLVDLNNPIHCHTSQQLLQLFRLP